MSERYRGKFGVRKPLKEIEYAAAHSVDEAVGLLAARGEKAKILAGGTDILVQLREGLRDADLIVDIKKIPELMNLSFSPQKGLHLGRASPVTAFTATRPWRPLTRRWPTRPALSAAGKSKAAARLAATCATLRRRPIPFRR